MLWGWSTNILTYHSFYSRLISKSFIKIVNVFLSHEKKGSKRKKENRKRDLIMDNVQMKISYNNLALKNILPVSKSKYQNAFHRAVIVRFVNKKDKFILVNKTSREIVSNSLNFELKLGELFKIDNVVTNFKNLYPFQVLQKRKNFVLLRKVFPVSLETNFLVNFRKYAFVKKNIIISYSTFKKQKTHDIVQGLPKVEQLLEARKKTLDSAYENIHDRLAVTFTDLQTKYSNDVAVRKSIFEIQEYLVNAVQTIYQSQGVNISDKHIEVIIKQMTSKVMITS